jgi:hypothetical protein
MVLGRKSAAIRASLARQLMLVAVIIAEHAMTALTIVRAYHLF